MGSVTLVPTDAGFSWASARSRLSDVGTALRASRGSDELARIHTDAAETAIRLMESLRSAGHPDARARAGR